MCGRFALTPKTKEIEKLLPEIKIDGDFLPRFNITPGQDIAAITNSEPSKINNLKWGLIPFWAKDPKIGYKMINARSETITEKPSFRSPFKIRRCAILSSGFYEWQRLDGGKKKIPHYIKLKDENLFCFAGLWETWKSPNDEIIQSASIITTAPNKLMEQIHNRMPVILNNKNINNWLNPEADIKFLKGLLVPYESNKMESYEVSTIVNNPANDIPECMLPVNN